MQSNKRVIDLLVKEVDYLTKRVLNKKSMPNLINILFLSLC